MKLFLNKCLIVFVLLHLFVFAKAQDKWTLDKCIQYGLDNNLNIKQSEFQQDKSKLLLDQKKWNLFPVLNGGVSERFTFGRSVDMLTYDYVNKNNTQIDFNVNTSVVLFDGFRNITQIKIAKKEYDLSASEIDRAKKIFIIEICNLYLNALFTLDNKDILLEQKRSTEKQIEKTKIFVEAGSIAKGELLEFQSQLANDELKIVNAQNESNMALLELALLLELDSVEDFSIVRFSGNDKVYELPPPEVILMEAKSFLPDYKIAMLKEEKAKLSIKEAKGGYLPVLQASGGYYTGFSAGMMDPATNFVSQMTFNEQIKNNTNKSLGLSLSIPIFNGFNVKRNVEIANINLKSVLVEKNIVDNQLKKDIYRAWSNVNAAIKKMEAAKKTVSSMEETFRYVSEKHNSGMVTALEMSISKTNLEKAKSDYLQAKYETLFKNMILDFYRGKVIGL